METETRRRRWVPGGRIDATKAPLDPAGSGAACHQSAAERRAPSAGRRAPGAERRAAPIQTRVMSLAGRPEDA
ncbi:hypothetical protein EYF80_057154 [Liparis tanakae]|uniref:Uncharacterized protein n=1 Tax=Liparis tanakae TaxID=230148 RepID=A0A4Z2EWE6_9TELE|nr:hypothetical protein EYF80_057154 [Liparis tanakae]